MFLKHLSTSSSKITYLTKSLYFIFVFCILAYAFQFFYERKIILGSESSSSYKINRILHNNDENEIPIFGPSTAQGGLIPGVLGPNFFNYGIDGMRDDVLLFFLQQECKKIKKNHNILVVFSLDGFTYSLGDLNSYILNSNNPDVKKLLGENYKFYYRIPFIKYYGYYESYLKDFLNERMMLTKYKDKGASIEKNVLTQDKFNILVEERKNTVTIFNNDSALEKRFIDLIIKNPNWNFIIVIPPFHPSYFYQYKNYNDAENFFSYLCKFSNISFLNYSHHFYPDDCYFNTTHLNYKGAVLFNKILKDTLSKICK